ncbi:MAG: cytochrome c oxidase subunit 4 [Chloroflexota bacterium]|nr:cytochrome c oxidase subunit 4 [Chloroflexota bacterium]
MAETRREEGMGQPDESTSFVITPRQGEGHTDLGELPPGWSRARPEHIPRPTYWPIVMAVGITVGLWGFILTWFISLVGLVLFAIALWGWIGEIRHEHD